MLRQLQHIDPSTHATHETDLDDKKHEILKAAIRKAIFHGGATTRKMLFECFERANYFKQGEYLPENAEYLENLEEQYRDAVSIWIQAYPLDVNHIPSQEDLAKWLSSLPKKVVDGLRELGANDLVLIPPQSASTLLHWMNAHKTIPGQEDSIIEQPDFWDNIGTNEWTFGITDLQEDLPFREDIYFKGNADDSTARTDEEIVAEYERRYAEKGLSTMPPHGYVPAAMRQMARKKTLDQQTSTTFKKPAGAEFLPSAGWNRNRLILGGHKPNNIPSITLRCRPWLEGR